jgi:uncharacterized phage protein (TIGR01671 family)
MNEQFKFRVWDKQSKDMNYLGYTSGEFMICFDNGKMYLVDNDNGDGRDITEYGVLMQCTGLKDKNGKWIYQEDVVKILRPSYPYLEGKIIFDHVLASFQILYQDGDESDIFEDLQDVEIIGNGWENPGLFNLK